MSGQVVVKLGGSLAGSARLSPFLDAIAGAAGRVVVVPGGGPFADAVRRAQGAMGFGDGAAHSMALLAMEQYALALADLCPALVPADDLDAIANAMRRGRVPVWRPSRLALAAPDLAASWDVTSDSLAAWLARRLGASALVLVKSVDPPPGLDAEALASRGLVDPALAQGLRHGPPAWIAGPRSSGALASLLAGRGPGSGVVRIEAAAPCHA